MFLFCFNFYNNPIFLSNVTYLYILRKCKYVNEKLFIDLTYNTFILRKHKFLFTFTKNCSIEKQFIAGRFDNQINVFMVNQSYRLYNVNFKNTQMYYVYPIIFLNLLTYYNCTQLMIKNLIKCSFNQSIILRQQIFFKIFQSKLKINTNLFTF